MSSPCGGTRRQHEAWGLPQPPRPAALMCLVKETKTRLSLSPHSLLPLRHYSIDRVSIKNPGSVQSETEPVKNPTDSESFHEMFAVFWRQRKTQFRLFDSIFPPELLHELAEVGAAGSVSQPVSSRNCSELFTHGGADFVAHSEVEATLLVHGVVDAGEFGELRPVVFKGVVQQAVVGAAERNRASNIQPRTHLTFKKKKQQQNLSIPFKKMREKKKCYRASRQEYFWRIWRKRKLGCSCKNVSLAYFEVWVCYNIYFLENSSSTGSRNLLMNWWCEINQLVKVPAVLNTDCCYW